MMMEHDAPSPVADRTWLNSFIALVIVVTLMTMPMVLGTLNGGFGQLTKPNQDVVCLRTLQQVLTEIRALRARGASDAEWAAAEAGIRDRMRPFVDDLKLTANRNHPAKQSLLWAARDKLPILLKVCRSERTPAETDVENHLAAAARILDVPLIE